MSQREIRQEAERSLGRRGLGWVSGFGLDLELGLRMLRKSWGLTLVAGLAVTVVVAILCGIANTHQAIYGTEIPLDEGQRVVDLVAWDSRVRRPQNLFHRDISRWRDTLKSLQDVGAFRTLERNLIVGNQAPEPVQVAEMTASGFQLARVAPLLGRPLLPEDERTGNAMVLGYHVWRTRFASDPRILGTRVKLGPRLQTVVGVMPEGFRFPVNHQFWTALKRAPGQGPGDAGESSFPVLGFARLALGVTLEKAQAELSAVGLLPSNTAKDEGYISPRVMPYAKGVVGTQEGNDQLLNSIFLLTALLLLFPPASNIGILIYARTVRRQEEFAARHALGATRSRIVIQLLLEVLVLSSGAAALGLAVIPSVGGILPATAGMIVLVGLLAALGPARRALRIDASEALREP